MGRTELPASLPSPEDDPEAALAAAVALRNLAERLEAAAVLAGIERGWSWAQVAQALGVTRQAAHKKHARTVRATRREDEA